MPLIEVLAAMERAGVKLDTKRLADIGKGMAERIDELEREIYDLAGPRVHHRLAAAARRGALQGARS